MQAGNAVRAGGMSWAAVTWRGAAAAEADTKTRKAADAMDKDERGGVEDDVGPARSRWDTVSSWNHSWNMKPVTPPGQGAHDAKSSGSWANVVAPKGSWASVVGEKDKDKSPEADTMPAPQVCFGLLVDAAL